MVLLLLLISSRVWSYCRYLFMISLKFWIWFWIPDLLTFGLTWESMESLLQIDKIVDPIRYSEYDRMFLSVSYSAYNHLSALVLSLTWQVYSPNIPIGVFVALLNFISWCFKDFHFIFYVFFNILFIYLFMRDKERRRHRQREKQVPWGKPDAGLYPRTPGPDPKADTQPLRHSGAPQGFPF